MQRARRAAAAANIWAQPAVPTPDEDPLVQSDADEADDDGEPMPDRLEDLSDAGSEAGDDRNHMDAI